MFDIILVIVALLGFIIIAGSFIYYQIKFEKGDNLASEKIDKIMIFGFKFVLIALIIRFSKGLIFALINKEIYVGLWRSPTLVSLKYSNEPLMFIIFILSSIMVILMLVFIFFEKIRETKFYKIFQLITMGLILVIFIYSIINNDSVDEKLKLIAPIALGLGYIKYIMNFFEKNKNKEISENIDTNINTNNNNNNL